DAGAALVNLHLLFNVALVVLSLPFVGLMERLLVQLMPPETAKSADEDPLRRRISALDRAVIDTPRLALASATRELLRMGELVEVRDSTTWILLNGDESAEMELVKAVDEDVNKAHSDIKIYLAEVNRGEMTSEEARRRI